MSQNRQSVPWDRQGRDGPLDWFLGCRWHADYDKACWSCDAAARFNEKFGDQLCREFGHEPRA